MEEPTVEKEKIINYICQERGPAESTAAGIVESSGLQGHGGSGHAGGKTQQPQRMKMMTESPDYSCALRSTGSNWIFNPVS